MIYNSHDHRRAFTIIKFIIPCARKSMSHSFKQTISQLVSSARRLGFDVNFLNIKTGTNAHCNAQYKYTLINNDTHHIYIYTILNYFSTRRKTILRVNAQMHFNI